MILCPAAFHLPCSPFSLAVDCLRNSHFSATWSPQGPYNQPFIFVFNFFFLPP